MDQKYETYPNRNQSDRLSNKSLKYSTINDYPVFGDHVSEFSDYNDTIALKSFVSSIHSALLSNDSLSIKMTFGTLSSSDKYPYLANALGAYISKQYQATLLAANLAAQEAKNDTSMNRNFAYCAAMLLIAHSRKRMGEAQSVIQTLKECQVHMENEIGTPARQWINEILASFFI